MVGESGVVATFLYQVSVHPCGAVCLLVTFYRALAMTAVCAAKADRCVCDFAATNLKTWHFEQFTTMLLPRPTMYQ